MKLNKVAMAVALTAALGSMSALADTTNGQIELQGELVNTACGLAARRATDFPDPERPLTIISTMYRFSSVRKSVRCGFRYASLLLPASVMISYSSSSLCAARRRRQIVLSARRFATSESVCRCVLV